MAENVETTVELKQNQLDFLDQMVQQYALPDRGKALRCLIVYAMQETAQQNSIFHDIRCTNC